MSYIDVYDNKKHVIVWERDGQGDLHEKKFPSSEFNYLFMPDNSGDAEYKDIYGTSMKKVSFDSRWEMRQFADGRENICESDLQPPYKALLDHYRGCDTEAPYNVLLWDIEVDFDLAEGKGYPGPKNPFGEINSISCFDVSEQKYRIFLYDHLKGIVSLKDDDYPVEMVWCLSERELLQRFCKSIDHIDIMSAWNSAGFDTPYVMERLLIHFGDAATSMLCRGGFDAKKRDFVNDYGEDVWEWILVGRVDLDLMKLYKKFVPGEAKSFKLDDVCERELGENKVEYDDDLGSLYREDPQLFFEYSLHDSRLLKLLDEKKQIIKLAMSMARDMCSLPNDVMGSVKLIEMGIIKHARDKDNIVVPNKKEHSKGEQYAGAVVYDSIPGRHEWVMSADLVSLYPKCMILLGLSPETMIAQCLGGYEDYVHIIERKDDEGMIEVEDVSNGDSFSLLPSEIDDMIRQEGFTISGNGTIFNGTLGLMAEWVSDNFDKRAYYKKRMKEEFSAGNEEEGKKFDLYQQVRKILINSCYGAAGNEHFRFYDIRLAQSVTLTAQVVSKAQAVYVNQAIEMLEGS